MAFRTCDHCLIVGPWLGSIPGPVGIAGSESAVRGEEEVKVQRRRCRGGGEEEEVRSIYNIKHANEMEIHHHTEHTPTKKMTTTTTLDTRWVLFPFPFPFGFFRLAANTRKQTRKKIIKDKKYNTHTQHTHTTHTTDIKKEKRKEK